MSKLVASKYDVLNNVGPQVNNGKVYARLGGLVVRTETIFDYNFLLSAMDYNLNILFGKNAQIDAEKFKMLLSQYLKEITIYPGDMTNERLNDTIPGMVARCNSRGISRDMITVKDLEDRYFMVVRGFKNHKCKNKKVVKHLINHELWHVFADLLPYLYAYCRRKDSIDYEEIIDSGMIGMIDKDTGRYKGTERYGKGFMESLIEIVTAIGLYSYDSDFDEISIRDILTSNPKDWNVLNSSYLQFLPFVQLAIAAFANYDIKVGDDAVLLSRGFVNQEVICENNTKMKVNDLLGYFFTDQFVLQSKFDYVMSNTPYEYRFKDLCYLLDYSMVKTMDNPSVETKAIVRKKLYAFVVLLKCYLTEKCKIYLRNKSHTKEDIISIINTFNEVLSNVSALNEFINIAPIDVNEVLSSSFAI